MLSPAPHPRDRGQGEIALVTDWYSLRGKEPPEFIGNLVCFSALNDSPVDVEWPTVAHHFIPFLERLYLLVPRYRV